MNARHSFDEELAYSHSQADAPYWQEVYKQAFPDMAACLDLRHDGWHQRAWSAALSAHQGDGK